MKRRFIIEAEEGDTKCADCPLDNVCSRYSSVLRELEKHFLFLDCSKYNLSEMKLEENQDET